jgi:hypothetical protein
MKSRWVQTVRFFFYLFAALWLVVGVSYFIRSDRSLLYWILSGLVIANIPVSLFLGANITKKFFHRVGVFYLLLCFILTITDDFGLADLIALILFAIPLVIMLIKRKDFTAT